MRMIAAPVLDSIGIMDMTDTLNDTWDAIRYQEPDVPPAAYAPDPGAGGGDGASLAAFTGHPACTTDTPSRPHP